MKLNRISIRDFQAVKHIDIGLDRPALLIAGPNEQGKSSILDAVRLALLDDSDRVSTKKDRNALVRKGAAKGATIEVKGDDAWLARINIPGKLSHDSLPELTEAHVSSLCSSYFASLKADARRAFLFPILGIKFDAENVTKRVLARGGDAEKLAVIAQHIGKKSWEDLQADAKQYASKARGAWEQITGETYGSQKAEGWLPVVPSRPDGTVNGMELSIKGVDIDIAELNQKIGALNAQTLHMEARTRKLAELEARVALVDRRTAAYDTARIDRAAMEGTVEGAKQVVAGQPLGTECSCPSCGAVLLLEGGALREKPSQSQHTAEDIAEARRALPGFEKSLAMLKAAEANAKRDLDDALAAVSALAELKADPPEQVDGHVLSELRAILADANNRRRQYEEKKASIEAIEKAIATAEATRDSAAQRHRHVVEWTALADLIGPSGVPGELLSEGLEPFNAKLNQLALLAGWDAPVIRDDMAIEVKGMPYGLGSVSARYRTDMLLSIAIAIFSGTKLVVLDGIEVLVGLRRSQLLKLVHELAGTVLDTVILAATLKEKPKLPGTYRVVWVEAGEIVEEEAEKVAA